MIKIFLRLSKRVIVSPIAFTLNKSYAFLYGFPRFEGTLSLVLVTAALIIPFSVVLWCEVFWVIEGYPSACLGFEYMYDFILYTFAQWLYPHRLAWLAAAAEYGVNHNFGPTPAYILYLNTFKNIILYRPSVMVFNMVLVLYIVWFSRCFSVILRGLIARKPSVDFTISRRRVAFRSVLLLLLLFIFGFGFGFGFVD